MLNRLSSWFVARTKSMETDEVKLPPDFPNWSIVRELLHDLQTKLHNGNVSDEETGWFMQTVYSTSQSGRQLSGSKDSTLNRLRLQIQSNVKKKLDHNCLWFGMLKHLRKVSRAERDKFLYSTLPTIIEFALSMEDCRPETPLLVSRQQHGGSTKLSRQFVCSIVACFFLCLFPERKRESSEMNIVNFTTFFKHLPQPAQVAKLRCILHYFECVSERAEIHGDIIFCRKVASSNCMLSFDELVRCDLKLCPLDIHPQGMIEDSSGTVQVCFGNKSVGGGVLGSSRVQEEIRFSVCPELLASLLFMENMEANEAILISGFEQFSSYTGYGDSLEFAGHYTGPDLIHTMVDIDAASYREAPISRQYEECSVLRDLNKAMVGFSWMPGTDSGVLQLWESVSREAVDVAADIVASAMTDALRQAAESPVEPESKQSSHVFFQQPSSQQHHHDLLQPPVLSSCHHQQLSELTGEFTASNTAHLQSAQNLPQLSSATDSLGTAGSVCAGLETSDSAVTPSGNLQTAQLEAHSAHLSLPSFFSSHISPNVNISVDSTSDLQPLPYVHSTGDPPSAASSCSAQISARSSLSSPTQQHKLLKQSAFSEQTEKNQRFPAHSPLADVSAQSSSTADTNSNKASQTPDNFNLGATRHSLPPDSSALVRDSQLTDSASVDADSCSKLTSDILGNLTRITISHSSGSSYGCAFDESDERNKPLHSCVTRATSGQHQKLVIQEHSHTRAGDNTADVALDLPDASKDTSADAVSFSSLPESQTTKSKLVSSHNVKTVVDECENLVDAIDVVLSLPVMQSEWERGGSGLSNSSMFVNIDSQSLSTNSAEEENNRQSAAEVLYVSVENSELPVGTWRCDGGKFVGGARVASVDSSLLEPPGSSPQSSVSSANISPNTAFLTPEVFQLGPPNGSNDANVATDFFVSGLEGTATQVQHSVRRGSRDFYGELRDFLSSSSSGSRGSGSGGPFSSTTSSSWGSRSGSISSHGTNGSTIDFPEFWSHFRRRSSQMSDAMSRRSSSSKHSSDFSTDLEDISEGVPKHNHGVIEEEGGLISLLADFASHFVSMAIRNGLATGAHLSYAGELAKEEGEFEQSGPKMNAEIGVTEQLDSIRKVGDSSSLESTVPKSVIPSLEESASLGQTEDKNIDPEYLSPVPELSLPSSSSSSVQLGPAYAENKRKLGTPVSQQSSVASSSSSLPSAKASSKFSSSYSPDVKPPLPSFPVISHSPGPINSMRTHQIEGHPLSSHSVDSGISSAVSSIILASQHKTVEPLIEENESSLRVNLSATAPEEEESMPRTNLAAHPVPTIDVSQIRSLEFLSGSSAGGLEFKDSFSESKAVNQSIPLSPANSKTLYATLESKTIYLSPENFPQSVERDKPVEQVELEGASCATFTAFIPLPSAPCDKNENSDMLKTEGPSSHALSHKSHIPKSSLTHTAEIQGQARKFFRRRNVRKEGAPGLDSEPEHKSLNVSEASRTASTGEESIPQGTVDVILQPGHASATQPRLPGIPKHKGSSKRSSTDHSESSAVSDSKIKLSQSHDISSTVKAGSKVSKDRKQKGSLIPASKISKKDMLLFKPHKSRYVVSDVAAPLSSKNKKPKMITSEEVVRKQSEKKSSSKKNVEKSKKWKVDPLRRDPLSLTRSSRFHRFVNSLAEISLSQAVLEGAEILTQKLSSHREISDELYNWFAGKIVGEVLFHVIRELNIPETSQTVEAPSGLIPSPENGELDNKEDFVQEGHVSGEETTERPELAVPKPKSILPVKLDTQTSGVKGAGAHPKPSASLKVVTFKDSREEEDSSPSSLHVQSNVALTNPSKATPTFHRQSSSGIPVPIRRRSSLDLPSPSPPGTQASSLSTLKSPLLPSSQQGHTLGQARLTSADLSIDIYRAAAAIVNQVFQAVSDSWDTQSLRSTSPGWYDTASSPEAGSRTHSHLDTIASNIFSSTSAQVSESPKRTRRSISPSIGIFSRKPMSRETLTSAFLKVDSTPSIKSYERRSSEPCQTSVQLSLQAFNSIKFNKQAVEDKQRKISRTDDDIGRGKTWRRGSLDGFSFERRNSCGFKDPVLSRFAEELMKADTSVPELVIVGSRSGSSSTGSRRSSLCGYRDTGQANLESELLNTSFTSVCSLPLSHSSRSQSRSYMERSHSRESRAWKSDSSDTEYWFPPPKFVGDEFQQEYNRQHSQEELQDYASFFAGRVVQEAVCVLKCDPEYMSKEEQDVDMFAENLTDQIIRDALVTLRGNGNHGFGLQKSSAFTKNSFAMRRTERGVSSAERKPYYGEGARPKTSAAQNRSKPPRDVSQRKEMKRKGCVQDSAASRRVSRPQQHLYMSSRPAATKTEESRQRSSVRHRVQKNTADFSPSPSSQKRHSASGSTLSPSSLSSHTPTIARPHLSMTSQHHHHHIEGKNMQRARGSLSVEHSQLEKLTKVKKEEYRADSATSVSSYQSERAGSSLASSSGSESIGPTGKDTPPRKQSAKKEHVYRGKTSHRVEKQQGSLKVQRQQESLKAERLQGSHRGERRQGSHKAERRQGSHKERSKKRDSFSRRTEAAHPKKMSGKGKMPHKEVEQNRIIDLFASSLSLVVLNDALMHCRHNRWLGFLSYHKPIATGNWGCGAFRGNAQLKLVIQWIAASVGQAPRLMYYTFNDKRLTQAQEVVDLISGLTVGQLAAALQDYCHWVRLNLASSSAMSFFSSSARSQLHFRSSQRNSASYSVWQDEHDSRLPQSLFDFLLEKFRDKDDR